MLTLPTHCAPDSASLFGTSQCPLRFTRTASYLSLYLPELTNLTVLVADASALSSGIVELQDVLTKACTNPMLSLSELYCSGLSISDEAFLRQSNNTSAIRTLFPALQKLSIHNASRVSIGALIVAIRTQRLPRLSYLEPIFAPSDFTEEDLLALYKTCAEAKIRLSEGTVKYYEWCE